MRRTVLSDPSAESPQRKVFMEDLSTNVLKLFMESNQQSFFSLFNELTLLRMTADLTGLTDLPTLTDRQSFVQSLEDMRKNLTLKMMWRMIDLEVGQFWQEHSRGQSRKRQHSVTIPDPLHVSERNKDLACFRSGPGGQCRWTPGPTNLNHKDESLPLSRVLVVAWVLDSAAVKQSQIQNLQETGPPGLDLRISVLDVLLYFIWLFVGVEVHSNF